MATITPKKSPADKNSKTYRVGLLQAKVYRVLRVHITNALKPQNISTVEWAFLGLLFIHPKGMQSSHAAAELGVEPPFITVLIKAMKRKKLAEIKPALDDSRVKCLLLTLEGRKFVTETEKEISHKIKPLFKAVSLKEMASYLLVLEKIIKSSQEQTS